MRRNLNQEVIEGRVYEQNLAIKKVQNQQSANFGKEFINGTISVATDEEGLNVLTVNYTYVTETTKAGGINPTYANLKRIMNGKTWINDGKDEAMKVRLNPSAELNDFYPQGGDELVSQQRSGGGFVSILSELNPKEEKRNTFKFDTIITGTNLVETEDGNDYLKMNCIIFNFRNDILPFTLIVKRKDGIDYFMNQEYPMYTQVTGNIINSTIKIEKTIESAFGEPVVDVTERKQREWVVNWTSPEPYVFNSEDTVTKEELNKAIADRNVYLEDIKTRTKEYYNTRSNNPVSNDTPPVPNASVPAGEFKF